MNDLLGNTNCGDCGATGPKWASLNHGILLCKDCCSVHRALGPQCSRVKSLSSSQWHPNQRKMLSSLASGPANHVWEHTLLDPSKSDIQMKKPGPSDSLEAVKKKFIHMKHLQHAFVLRQRPETFIERNQELHSTVRTGDLGTTLRLLASGVDPNFFHPEKGTRPLHVAARTGQALQVELLFLHGAQTDAPDYLGQTPVEHALAAGFKDLAQRIVELQYHLTDHLSYYACKEMPDHSTSKHIILPRTRFNTTKQEIIFRTLSSHVLEQLASDLYDEVDRRQLEKDMMETMGQTEFPKYSIAFLPVHSHFSSVHNQTRQKFARLTEEELVLLITVVLMESKKRHCNDSMNLDSDRDIFVQRSNLVPPSRLTNNGENVQSQTEQLLEDDDFPLYDSVASDEDLILTEQQTILAQQRSTMPETPLSSLSIKPISSCGNVDGCLAKKLVESEAKVQELQDSNQTMKMEISVLYRMINTLIHENLELKSTVLNLKKDAPAQNATMGNGEGLISPRDGPPIVRCKPPRPQSLCEPSYQVEKYEGPPRPNTTSNVSQRNVCQQGGLDLVHETTRKVVEYIKVLIEYAQANDHQGVQLTCSKIYNEAQSMASRLLVTETRKHVKDNIENVILQVLRMKSEIFLLNDLHKSNNLNTVKPSHSSEDSQEMLQKVKKICFDVGAAMKVLVSSIG